MNVINYKDLNETEIKKINENEKILIKSSTIFNDNDLKDIYNTIYYDFTLNENELKEKILFNIKSLIFENVNNIKDLLNYIYIKYSKKEIYIYKNDMITKFKINDNEIFNKVINFLNIENKDLKEFIEIIKKYKKYYKRENDFKEIIKEYEIELKNIRSENYKIKRELKNKFNYDLYYF